MSKLCRLFSKNQTIKRCRLRNTSDFSQSLWSIRALHNACVCNILSTVLFKQNDGELPYLQINKSVPRTSVLPGQAGKHIKVYLTDGYTNRWTDEGEEISMYLQPAYVGIIIVQAAMKMFSINHLDLTLWPMFAWPRTLISLAASQHLMTNRSAASTLPQDCVPSFVTQTI